MLSVIDKIQNSIDEDRSQPGLEEELVIFGATEHGEKALSYLESKKRTVLCFYDNDQNKWGHELAGEKIEKPSEEALRNKSVVIVSTSYADKIYEQLLTYGVRAIYIFFEDINKIEGMETILSLYDNSEILNKPIFTTYDTYIEIVTSMEAEFNKQLIKTNKNYELVVKKLKSKTKAGEKIRVVFFVAHSSVWKYADLYKLLRLDDRFLEPTVVVTPITDYGRDNMLDEMNKTYLAFKQQDYNVIKAYDEEKNEFLDVKTEIDPDIVFYSSPYKGQIHSKYYINNFLDKLSCYVNYGYDASVFSEHIYRLALPNLVWTVFLENKMILDRYERLSKNKGINGIITGFPGVDGIKYRNNDEASEQKQVKKIIWAPHHTIAEIDALNYSNFMNYYDEFLSFADKYKNKIHITFKPHPLLKIKLYNHKDWGRERTDNYYEKWERRTNTSLNTDDYIELFNDSDAMIHDSGSFVAEYLYTGKAVLYMMKDSSYDEYNDFGKLALDCHYHSFNLADVEKFIEYVVINDEDSMRENRNTFYENILKISNKNGSENIYDYICQALFE